MLPLETVYTFFYLLFLFMYSSKSIDYKLFVKDLEVFFFLCVCEKQSYGHVGTHALIALC